MEYIRPAEERMNAIDLCAYVGLAAVFLVTVNVSIGLLIAVRYSPVRYWPYHQFNIFRLHYWTGGLALAASMIHPVILLFSPASNFRLRDIVYPVHSPTQPLVNSIGAIALYLVVFVVVTSFFRVQLGRRLWKAFHFFVYAAAIALFWHSIFTDPNLKNSPIDFLDGEKVFVEICCLLIVAFGIARWRVAVRKARTR